MLSWDNVESLLRLRSLLTRFALQVDLYLDLHQFLHFVRCYSFLHQIVILQTALR